MIHLILGFKSTFSALRALVLFKFYVVRWGSVNKLFLKYSINITDKIENNSLKLWSIVALNCWMKKHFGEHYFSVEYHLGKICQSVD